jgi:outer membrane protein
MKKLALITILSIAVTFSSSFAQKANLNIGVINVEEVLKNSTVMKHVKLKISKKEKSYQSQIDKKQKSLEKEIKKIESKRSVLSKNALEKEKQKFANNFNKLKSELEVKQKSLKKAYVNSMTQLDKKINTIVLQISNEQNIDLILPSSQIISYKDELDISPEVLKRLNKEMKTIKVIFD